MIDIFRKRYKACSNLFVNTLENENLVFPSPISLCAIIEDEQKSLVNELELKVTSYEDSPLTLNVSFSLFFYLLTFDYKMESFYVDNLTKASSNQEMDGYKGLYRFVNTDVAMNIGLDEIYARYMKIKNTEIELEEINY